MDRERLITNIVGPDGPLDAKMLFVGEGPGREEDEASPPRPFVGASGRLLNRCLRGTGILRDDVLVTNVFCQRPPNNDLGYFYQDAKKTQLTWEGEEHVARLQRWLERLLERRNRTGEGPNVLVALGAEPLKILTGKRRITKWRGSVLPCTLVPGFKVYGAFHPSYVNRLMQEKPENLYGKQKVQAQNALPLFMKDLERVEIQSEFPELIYPKRTFAIVRTIGEAKARIRSLLGEKYIGVDIETLRGPDGPILWFLGFSPRPEYAFTIPFLWSLRPQWSLREEAVILREVSEIFLNPDIMKVFQGGSYDLSILGRYYGLRLANGTYEDTMLSHHASYPFLRKGLEVLVSVHTWEPYYKDDGKVWDGRRISDEAEGIYNCKDCAVTREIIPKTLRDCKELGTLEGYRRTLSIFPVILYKQIKGVRIDLEKKAELTRDLEERLELLEKELIFLAGTPLNLNSPQQVGRLLYGDLELEIQYDRKTKKVTTDKAALQKLLLKEKNKEGKAALVLKALLSYRKFEKLRSTYAEMEVDSDGRIHTSYDWISTWRLNSSESPFGKGGNLQNIPKKSKEGREIRKLFVPDLGYVFLARDLSQAESMLVAWLAGDLRLIELYLEGVDVHWERTKDLFGLPKDLPYEPKRKYELSAFGEPRTLKWLRDLQKPFTHGGNYKMGYRKLQSELVKEGFDIPLEFCRKALESFRAQNPLTVQWQNKTEETLRATRTLVTPLGRRREFRGRFTDDLIRAAVAFVPQSTVGEMCQLGMRRMYDKDKNFQPLFNNHDENLGQCRPKHLASCNKNLIEAMRIPIQVNNRELIIPGESSTGPSWGELEELRDGEGLETAL